MNLTELSDGWNNLRNAVIGRGVEKPAGVSTELYRATGAAYDEWRAFYTQNLALLQSYGAVELVDLPASTWVKRYRELESWARADGIKFLSPGGVSTALKESPTETAERVTTDLGRKLEVGLVIVALGFGALIALKALRR
jgi:hypothetical protein